MSIDAVGPSSSESFQEANVASPTENSDILGIIFTRLSTPVILRDCLQTHLTKPC